MLEWISHHTKIILKLHVNLTTYTLCAIPYFILDQVDHSSLRLYIYGSFGLLRASLNCMAALIALTYQISILHLFSSGCLFLVTPQHRIPALLDISDYLRVRCGEQLVEAVGGARLRLRMTVLFGEEGGRRGGFEDNE